MTFVITAHTHPHTRALKIHRCHCLISGMVTVAVQNPLLPRNVAAATARRMRRTRLDSGDGAVCHGTLHTAVCADYLPAIRSSSIAFVPGLLSCTLCKKSARTRRRVLSGMLNVLCIMTCLHENA